MIIMIMNMNSEAIKISRKCYCKLKQNNKIYCYSCIYNYINMNSEDIKDYNNVKMCSICNCDLIQVNKIKLKCNHIYCYTCIYDWFKIPLNTKTFMDWSYIH